MEHNMFVQTIILYSVTCTITFSYILIFIKAIDFFFIHKWRDNEHNWILFSHNDDCEHFFWWPLALKMVQQGFTYFIAFKLATAHTTHDLKLPNIYVFPTINWQKKKNIVAHNCSTPLWHYAPKDTN